MRAIRVMQTPRGIIRAFLAAIACLVVVCPVAAYRDFRSSMYARGAAVYLDRPQHAHAAALSAAVTAWRDDLAGVQFNPALLDAADMFHFCASTALLSFDRKLRAVSFVAPIGDYIVVEPGFAGAGVNDIEKRNEQGYPVGTFNERQNAVSIGVAGRLPRNFSVGLRGRYLNEYYKGVTDGSGHGAGFDIGVAWQPATHICIGLSVLNIGSYVWWATGRREVVLTQARLGITGKLFENRLQVGCDLAQTAYHPLDVAMGLEYSLTKVMARAGMNTSIDIGERHVRRPDLSLGIGIRHAPFGFDYSLVIPFDNTAYLFSQKFSLILVFKSLKEI